MYDLDYARATIGSKPFQKLAEKESRFLMSTLGLNPGDRLLDVPCGTGRHSAVFAAQGLEVTGVDISEACLKLARSAGRGKNLRLRMGDMSKLARYRGKFDAAVNLFTSFGYFYTDLENEQVMKELVSALKPGGRLAIHLVNRDWLLKVFQEVAWHHEKETFVIETREYDPKTHFISTQRVAINSRTNKSKVYRHRMRLYSKSEMIALMKRCGLSKVRVFGDFDGGAFNKLISSHPIYVGIKGLPSRRNGLPRG